MALPNTIILGAQKAGTTSLFNWISQHPDVYGEPGMKDFPFFVTDEYFNNGYDWFSNRFKKHKNEKIILHGFVSYMYFYQKFTKRIQNYNKNTKYIIVLRNPIDRAYSAYWFNRKVGIENCSSFEKALCLEKTGRIESHAEIGAFTYLDHGFYHQQLTFLMEHIDKSKLLVILFDDMIKNRSATLIKIYKFLNISSSFIPNFKKKNEAGIPRSSKIQKIFVHSFFNGKLKIIKNILPIEKRIKLKHWIRNFNIKKINYPPINDNTRKELESLYANEINKLEKLLEIDLSIWKTK